VDLNKKGGSSKETQGKDGLRLGKNTGQREGLATTNKFPRSKAYEDVAALPPPAIT